MSHLSDQPAPTRRDLLATAAAATTVGTAGCLRELRSVLTAGASDQLSLSITAVPASDDPIPISVANRLRDHLEAVGIATSVELRSPRQFRVEVLYNHDFDLAITAHPGLDDPDTLYSLLHSRLGPERGWQNPYGWDDLIVDDHLEAQRGQAGAERAASVETLLEHAAEAQPFTPLWFAVRRRAVNTDRLDGGYDGPFEVPSDLLGLEVTDPDEKLSLSITAIGPTQNLNPLSVEHRDRGLITGLLYDALCRRIDGEYRPWLADSVDWEDDQAVVSLRSVSWHDGEALTADDVVFTYELLADTTLGAGEAPIPAPRFRGRRTLVDEVTALDDQTVAIGLNAASNIAVRALTVPILPEHIWRDRTDPASVEGFLEEVSLTEALIHDNRPPIGSGPYAYDRSTDREYLDLARVDDHPVHHVDDLAGLRPLPPSIAFEVSPNDGTSLDWVSDGSVALTLGPLRSAVEADDLPDDVELVEAPSTEHYHVMYNTRRSPLSNANLRRVIARLLDVAHLAEEVPAVDSRPTATPVADEAWIPAHLAFDGEHPTVPFLGEAGELDVEAARDALIDIGIQFDDGQAIQPG